MKMMSSLTASSRRVPALYGLALLVVAAAGCATDATGEGMTKADARALAGKGDTTDWCALFDWYDDEYPVIIPSSIQSTGELS